MATEITTCLEPLKKVHLRVELIGDGELMLNQYDRLTKEKMIFQQENPRGTTLPNRFNQPTNKWQNLITSIRWEKPIQYHDDNISLYTEAEWLDYMKNNRPCILTVAFIKSFKEAVITFYKSSGLKGTDLRRSIVQVKQLCPVDFDNVYISRNIVNTQENGKGSPVLLEANVFQGWKTEIEIKVPEIVFPQESMLAIIQSAGEFIGIGSQRANGFGRYHIGNVVKIES